MNLFLSFLTDSFLVLLLPCAPSFDLLSIDNDRNIMRAQLHYPYYCRLIFSYTVEPRNSNSEGNERQLELARVVIIGVDCKIPPAVYSAAAVQVQLILSEMVT